MATASVFVGVLLGVPEAASVVFHSTANHPLSVWSIVKSYFTACKTVSVANFCICSIF